MENMGNSFFFRKIPSFFKPSIEIQRNSSFGLDQSIWKVKYFLIFYQFSIRLWTYIKILELKFYTTQFFRAFLLDSKKIQPIKMVEKLWSVKFTL